MEPQAVPSGIKWARFAGLFLYGQFLWLGSMAVSPFAFWREYDYVVSSWITGLGLIVFVWMNYRHSPIYHQYLGFGCVGMVSCMTAMFIVRWLEMDVVAQWIWVVASDLSIDVIAACVGWCVSHYNTIVAEIEVDNAATLAAQVEGATQV